jgi:hypothetical protein
LLDTLKVKFEHLMKRSAVEQTKYFRKHETRGNRPDKRRANGLPSE